MSRGWLSVAVLGAFAFAGGAGARPADWTSPTRVDTHNIGVAGVRTWQPKVVTSGDTIHAIWVSQVDRLQGLYYARSADCGESWSKPVALTRIKRKSPRLAWTALAVAGDLVHVVWMRGGHNYGANRAVYHQRSLDGGTTWKGRTRVAARVRNAFFPQAAARGAEVSLLWHLDGDRLVTATSSDTGEAWALKTTDAYFNRSGNTFSSAFALLPGNPQGAGRFRMIEADGEYDSERDKVIHRLYDQISKDGRTWFPGKAPLRVRVNRLDIDPVADGGHMAATGALIAEGTLDVFWVYSQSIKYGFFFQDIYHRRNLGGDRWSARRRVNRGGTDAWEPGFAIGGDVLAATWMQPATWPERGDLHVGVAVSVDDGNNWRREQFPTSAWMAPAVAVSNEPDGVCAGTVHLLHAGELDGLVYRRSLPSVR